MKNILLILFITAIIISCHSKKLQVNDYFSDNQKDSLLTNIVTYLYILAPNATNQTKFEPQFKNFYTKNTSKFDFQNYYQAEDGWNYFLIIRPVAGGSLFKRGVLGKFKLKENRLMNRGTL